MQIETTSATLESGMPITLYCPQDSGDILPTVVLLHERYGLVQHTGDLARTISTEGYCVVTPNIFYYLEDQDSLHKGMVKASPSDPFVLERLDETVQWIGQGKYGDVDKLAMIGVCQTGRYPVIYGSRRQLKACIVLYGAVSNWEKSDLHPQSMDEVIRDLNSPLLGLYGELDHSIPIAAVLKLRNALEQSEKSYRIKIFEDAPHGWLNSTMPGRYRKISAENAMYEMVKFLKQYLSVTSLRPNRIRWEFESDKDRDYDFSRNVRFE